MAGALSSPPTQHDGEPLEESPRGNALCHQGSTEATKMNVVREDIVSDPISSIPEHWFKAALLHRVDKHLATLVCEKLKTQSTLSDEGWTEMEYDKLKQSKQENGGSSNGVVSQDGQQVGNVSASAENASVGTQDPQAAASSSGTPKQDATDPKSRIDEPSFFGPLANISNKTLAILQELKGEKRKARFLNFPSQSLRSEGSRGQYELDMAVLEETRSTSLKTGIPFFMAVEVEAGDLLFDPNDILDEDEKSRELPFRYRYLHDLESLFWILVYFLFAAHPMEPEEEMDEQLDDGRLANFQTLFPYPTGKVQHTVVRSGFLKGDRAIRAMVTSFLPDKLRRALANFYYIARDLKQEYQRVEANPMKLRAEDPLKLYKSTMTHLDTLLNSPEKPAWLDDVMSLSRNASAGKRKAATVTDDSTREKERHT